MLTHFNHFRKDSYTTIYSAMSLFTVPSKICSRPYRRSIPMGFERFLFCEENISSNALPTYHSDEHWFRSVFLACVATWKGRRVSALLT